MVVLLQELCSHEPLAPTWHAKYEGQGLPPPLATLALKLNPAAAARAPAPRGLLGGGGGAAWAECALQVGWRRVGWRACGAWPQLHACVASSLFAHEHAPSPTTCRAHNIPPYPPQGSGAIAFERHDEEYAFTLPSLVLTDPLEEAREGESRGGYACCFSRQRHAAHAECLMCHTPAPPSPPASRPATWTWLAQLPWCARPRGSPRASGSSPAGTSARGGEEGPAAGAAPLCLAPPVPPTSHRSPLARHQGGLRQGERRAAAGGGPPDPGHRSGELGWAGGGGERSDGGRG